MTSQRPYWCPKTMKRRPCWCPKPILWELNSFLMQTLSFVPINLHRGWPREWKHSIGPTWSPGKFSRPFIHPCKRIGSLLARLLHKGKTSFPTLLAGKFPVYAHPAPFAKFFTRNLSIKRHRVPFMRTWIRYFCLLAGSQVSILVIRNWVLWYY